MPDLVDAFEAGTVTAFPHRSHVEVAWGLAQRYPREEAFARLAAGIRRIGGSVYHETITRAWFELITRSGGPETTPALFDKTLLAQYYSPERLAAGRHEWVEPDLRPLP